MKKIFFILLFCPLISWGQLWEETTFQNGSVIEWREKQDTIKVIMLICDTSSSAFGVGICIDSISNKWKQIAVPYYLDTWAKWQYGYEIDYPTIIAEVPNPDYMGENRTCLVWGCTKNHGGKTIKIYEKPPSIYLDENKNPLSKTIIIWQIKKIN